MLFVRSRSFFETKQTQTHSLLTQLSLSLNSFHFLYILEFRRNYVSLYLLIPSPFFFLTVPQNLGLPQSFLGSRQSNLTEAMSFTSRQVFFVLSVLALTTMPFSAGVTNPRDGKHLSSLLMSEDFQFWF